MQFTVSSLVFSFLIFVSVESQFYGQPYIGYQNNPCVNLRYPYQLSRLEQTTRNPCGYSAQYPFYNQNYQPSYEASTASNDVNVEYIDVSPEQFREYMKRYKVTPTIIPIPPQYQQPYQPGYQQPYQPQYQQLYQSQYVPPNPRYIVKTSSSQSGDKNQPKSFIKHDVQNKVLKFSNTYVITPEDRDRVINLNFVNGVPVTTTTEEETTTEPATTTTTMATTTEEESDYPEDVNTFVNPDGSVLVK